MSWFFRFSGIALTLVVMALGLSTSPASTMGLRDGQPPHIEYLRGGFGGPYWSEGWLWVRPDQLFRLFWKADNVRWCNKWGNFQGLSRASASGAYRMRLYGANPNSAHGGWVFGLTCGNGDATPNAVVSIWVKVVT